VPGLSSFVFFHGLLVGGLLAALLVAGRLYSSSGSSSSGGGGGGVTAQQLQQAAPVLSEEVRTGRGLAAHGPQQTGEGIKAGVGTSSAYAHVLLSAC
jgi:hypothetical protein